MSAAERGEGLVLLAAGGTGGHLFPAEALADELKRMGFEVALVTDKRVGDWTDRFPGEVHELPSGTVTGRRLVAKVAGAIRLAMGTLRAFGLIGRLKPAIVVGFGGYPTVPPMLAARFRGVPTLLHEANAVMGRANRFLASGVTAIATGLPLADDPHADRAEVVGNPVRRPVLHAAGQPYDAPKAGGPLRLLVFGGSQGARVMSDVVPGALEHLPEALRRRLHVTQQARTEDQARVERKLDEHAIAHEVAPFFLDLPKRIAESHLVIGRAGASTIAELTVIGRPSIVVPLPGSLDQDQAANAAVLAEAGGTVVVPQPAFTPVSLAELIERLAGDPERLVRMAAAARSLGVPDASLRLARQVLSILRAA